MQTIRLMKSLVALCVGGMAGLYATLNLLNTEAAIAFAQVMLAQADRPAYPNMLFPATDSVIAATLVFGVIIVTEIAAAVFSLWGAWLIFQDRAAPAGTPVRKNKAILGAGLGVLVWFGYFQAIGGGGLQFWQAPAGQGPFEGSFMFATLCLLSLIFIAQAESDSA